MQAKLAMSTIAALSQVMVTMAAMLGMLKAKVSSNAGRDVAGAGWHEPERRARGDDMTLCPYCDRFQPTTACRVPRCGGFVCPCSGRCNREEKFSTAEHIARHQ